MSLLHFRSTFLFICSLLYILCILSCVSCDDTQGQFQIGIGIADITGPTAEVGFMGYAVVGQTGQGIHIRLRARAFIIGDPLSGRRICYITADSGMAFQMVGTAVFEQLQSLYGDLYTEDNVMISGTHTHSTPGGLGGTALVDITTFGFVQQNYDAVVYGFVRAIQRAHNNIKLGSIKINEGELHGANINRSPASYLQDPDNERAQYKYNTDHIFTVLRFEDMDNNELGMLSFFAVHGTSMNNTNRLVSGDNKGVASQLFERLKNGPNVPSGQGPFVAGFGQSNLGDVSPNTNGPRCPDGSQCGFNTSTCGGKTEGCIASGPGRNMEESCLIIGTKQYEMALALYMNATEYLTNGVDYRFQYNDMQHQYVNASYTSTGRDEVTCRPAMGYSFAAGTTDGPGDFDFTQGTKSKNPFWAFVSAFLAKPTAEQEACHAPKPILLDVGEIKPLEWTPFVLPNQIFRIGNFFIVAVPGEFTTMSGRRLRNALKSAIQQTGQWTDNSRIVIAGLANSYSHYITTFEEYQLQRYEGASTLYGPHTLAAYTQIYSNMITNLVSGLPVSKNARPDDMRNKTFSFLPGVIFDTTPSGKSFGEEIQSPASVYTIGDTAKAVFVGANLRNELFNEKSYMYVEKLNSVTNEWEYICDDGCWETKFEWHRIGVSNSHVITTWTIPTGTTPGTYRFRTVGVYKVVLYTKPYEGISSTFTVQA